MWWAHRQDTASVGVPIDGDPTASGAANGIGRTGLVSRVVTRRIPVNFDKPLISLAPRHALAIQLSSATSTAVTTASVASSNHIATLGSHRRANGFDGRKQ
jgi:hypothetical protein